MDTPIFRDPHRSDTLFLDRMRQMRAADAVLAEAQEHLRAIFVGEELASYPCDARDCGSVAEETGTEIVVLIGGLRPDLTDAGQQIVSDAARATVDAERERV